MSREETEVFSRGITAKGKVDHTAAFAAEATVCAITGYGGTELLAVAERAATAGKADAAVETAAVTEPIATAKTAAVTEPIATAKTAAVTEPIATAKTAAVTEPIATAKTAATTEPIATALPSLRLLDGCMPHRSVGRLCGARGCLVTDHALPKAVATVETDGMLSPALRALTERQNGAIARWQDTAVSCLAAAERLCRRRMVQQKVDAVRVRRYAARLYARERMMTMRHAAVPPSPDAPTVPAVYPCFLSAVTPNGLSVRYDTLCALCCRIYVIDDPIGAVSAPLLLELCRRFCSVSRCLVGYCPVTGQIDHLLLPDSGVGFTHSNAWHTADFPVYRRIHATRFYSAPLSDRRAALYQRAIDERLSRASHLLAKAAALSQQQALALARHLTAVPAFPVAVRELIAFLDNP